MGKQADRGVRGGAHPLPRLALIHESSLVADELRAQLIAKHLTKDEQVKIARHFREIFAGPKDRSGGVQTDDDCLSWFDKFFRRRVVVAPRQETLTALGAKLGAALESEPRASGKASITELTAVAR